MFSNILLNVFNISTENISAGMFGGLMGFLAGLMVVAIILALAIYVYMALALQTIGKKLNYKNSWLAWIPIANYAMVLELGGFHWALIFLLLIPFLGWIAVAVLIIIALWRIFEKRNYPGWLALTPLLTLVPFLGVIAGIAYLVIFGLVAWKDQ